MTGPQALRADLLLQRWDERGTDGVSEIVGLADQPVDGLDLCTDEVVGPVEELLVLGIRLKTPHRWLLSLSGYALGEATAPAGPW